MKQKATPTMIYLYKEQREALAKAAEERESTWAAVIRELIDEHLAQFKDGLSENIQDLSEIILPYLERVTPVHKEASEALAIVNDKSSDTFIFKGTNRGQLLEQRYLSEEQKRIWRKNAGLPDRNRS
jgi:predicted DNA-binding protein